MKKRVLSMVLCSMLVMSLAACGSNENSEEQAEEPEETEETQEETLEDEEVVEDYDLVNMGLPELAEQIGKMTYDEAIEYIEKTGYAYEAIEPSEEDAGNIKTEADEDGFALSLWIYPDDDDNWTLSLVTYGNGNYEGSVSDNYHMENVVYKVYNVYEEEKSKEVASIEDVLAFLNDEVPLLIEEHKADSEGKENIDVTLNATDQIDDSGVVFTIETNLPTGTELSLSLNGDDYTAQGKVTVEDGKAVSGAFSNQGEQLKGDFTLNVTSVNAKQQPDEVQEVIGVDGEYLSGDLVSEGISGYNVTATFDFSF